ncbi:DUF6247 family protein [Actinomadura decatromicini]|uniref:Uncharacterized protein n=1 Tax=Actinomadura decatromicini TaxID=2604572 RepID=A0A5D3F7V3_9ACTN|nr:DUF6247 family protein [Actinomadura decatromicini]TYK45097.1 hypothetical protein FXF68_30920 [Actinomadura decatromicini]
MSAQPIHEEPDDRDPQVIHDRLPESVRAKFLTEYHAAVDRSHDLSGYRELRELLKTWSVLAAAYAKPDFHQRYQDVRDGVGEYVSMDEVFSRHEA